MYRLSGYILGLWLMWSLWGRVTGPKGHQSEGSVVRRVIGPKITVNCVEQQV